MDIRNFFSPTGVKKAVKKDPSSDTRKSAGDVNGNHKSRKDKSIKSSRNGDGDSHKKKRPKKGAIIFDSDSDEEDPLPKQMRGKKSAPITLSDSEEEKPQKKPRKSEPKAEPKPEKKKAVNAADFFGVDKVHQKERKGAVKRKAEESPVKAKPREEPSMEMHDDEDFEKLLANMDAKQPAKKAKTATSSSNSVASKIAALKRTEVLVKDTPDKMDKTDNRKDKTHGTIHVSPPKHKTSPKDSPKQSKDSSAKDKHKEKDSSKKDKNPSKDKSSSKITPEKKSMPNSSKVTPEKKSVPSTSKVTPEKKSPAKKSPEGGPGSLKRNNTGYKSFLLREGPRALGSKPLPENIGENCLENLTFVISGILESFERDEMKNIIEKYGGKVTGSLSKKTSYLVAGRDAGESKLAKAVQLKTTQLDEDGVLDLLKKLPGKKSKYEIAAEKEAAAERKGKSSKSAVSKVSKSPVSTKSPSIKSETPSVSGRLSQFSANASPAASSQSSQLTASPQVTETEDGTSLMWVDKYKPQGLKQIIGQQGDKSNARKLLNWLNNWHRNIAAGKKPAFGNHFSNDGAGYRAALLSGPPGVGKTTTATLVCKEAGFSFVELNASDKRSKRSLKEEVAEALGNHTLMDFFGKKHTCDGQKHCLIMDEVDGMAGNEDRGGMAELIQLIKHTKIPIITMCNDRHHPKVRSLANHTFDLRFQRPRVEQIKSAMMSIAFKEGIKIPPSSLNEVISAANQDVRQVIHNLSMWTAKDKTLTHEQIKSDAQSAKKDLKVGPFDVCRDVFAGGEHKRKMTINNKADMFFQDYSFGPLFVHENYIHVTPYAARGNNTVWLDRLSKAADAIAQGDLIDRQVRSGGHWNLLPIQAIYSSVIPGEAMEGAMSGMVAFPQWLGKNSSRGKTDRQLQELKAHMTLRVSADKTSLNMDYLPALRRYLTEPLIRQGGEGVGAVIDKLDHYSLLREDYDSVLEVTQWPDKPDPMKAIDSKVKAAFTRTYNKESHLTPYASGAAKKGRGRGGGGGGGGEELMEMEGEGEETVVAEEEEEEEEDLSKDTMIKQKKASAKGKATTASTSKGKGTGKGSGKGSSKGSGKGKGRK